MKNQKDHWCNKQQTSRNINPRHLIDILVNRVQAIKNLLVISATVKKNKNKNNNK